MTTHFHIADLHCESCVKFCTLKFKKIAGVTAVTIDLATGESSIEADQAVPLERLQEALAGTDYTIEPAGAEGSVAPAA